MRLCCIVGSSSLNPRNGRDTSSMTYERGFEER
jgi:hypothetical protein